MKKFTQIFIVFFVAIFILSTFFFNQNDTLIDQPKREFNAITNTNDEILVNELENTKNESDTENESDIVKDGSTDYLIDHFNPDLASADFPIAPEISTELSKINNFKVDPKTEILSKRDRTSKHYLREDGKTIDAILSPKSVHYKDEDGSWKDIDTKLLPSEKRDYVFANTANNLQSWFPADLTTYGVIIKTDKAEIVMGENLTMSWGDKNGNPLKSERFRRTKPEVKGNILNYNNVLPYIHNQYVVQQDEIKHNIILEQKPDIINETDFLYFGEGIQLPENYSLQFDQNSEGLVVLDDNGQVYLEIPAPQVYEENNQTVVASAPYASFEIEESPEPGNTYVIIVKVSAEWLNERTFPVVIDPTIILNGNSSGYIYYDYYYSGSGSNATTHRNYNAYNSTSARIALNRNYYYRSSWSWYRSVDYDYYKGWIKYNTSSIPDDKAINQIEFSANISGGYTGNLYTYIYSSSTPGNYSTSTNSSQYNAITAYPHGGTYYSGYGQYPYVVLNTNSNSRLQALLPNDYFQIGLYSNYSTRGGAQTKTFNTSSSLLRVTYESACAGPVVLCRDFTVQLDANGNVEITTVDIDNGSTAECGLQSITLSKTNFTCADVGNNLVTLTVTDVNGAMATCQATVTVEDSVEPVAIAKDITVQLDANGTASITALDIDNGSNDACGILSLEADNSFDCSQVGANTVTLTVTDNNNNVSTTTATVTLEDSVEPVAIAKDITVQLDANGTASITATDIDNGSNDACGILSLEADNSFDCSHVGANTVTLTVTDNNNNVSTTTATVTLEDSVEPVAIAKDITVQLDVNGAASITATDIDNGSNDACGILSLEADNSFDCSHVGANTVTLTVTDNNNNVSTTTATVTVEDSVEPVAIAKDITVQLDVNGAASITAADIDNGSNDACGILSLEADNSFDCSHVGANTVTLTVTDNNNNVSTTTATVTVEDTVDPVALAKDITVQLDANGTASITAADIDNGSNDACGILSLEADNSFDCSHVGDNTVTLTVTDNNNNVSTTTATVTLEDSVEPVAIAKDITVQLDVNGAASITATDIDNGSNDACGILSLEADNSFDCSHVGANTVTLTVTDNNNNVSTTTATVTLEDSVEPVAIAKDITVQLDVNGAASITAADIDNGSNDACGILSLEADNSFDCSHVGANTVTLTVTDNNNNVSTTTATVTVEDTVDPVALAKDITVQLDANGTASITAADIDNGSNDACGILSLEADNSFDCSHVGDNTVTLTVTDNNNNVSTTTATVTVEDNIIPVITASSDITQTADSGLCGAMVAIVDATATDNCSVGAVTGTRSDGDALTALYPVGETTITWTVTDINNNDAIAVTQKVAVTDNEAPVITASSDITQTADSGICGAILTIVDATATDNCSVGAVSGTRSDGEALTALYPVGETTITWTVTDIHNNAAIAVTQEVTVTDDEAPSILGLPSNIVVNNDPLNCSAIVNWTVPTVSDNCGVLSFESSHNSGDTFPEGVTTVTYTATDIHNNVFSASFDIDVRNTLPNNTDGIIGGIYPIQAGTDFYLSAEFNDDNLESVSWYFSSDGDFTNGDTAEYSFDYSGGVSGGTVSRMFSFDASQTGVYTVKVVVTDACGETAEVKYSYVVIYDPSGGFVTGGGWIFSPVGALVGSNTKGKANFGFVAKYKTGKNDVLTLDGNTNFQFKEGDFHFKSNEYDEMSLVISGGKKATYRGTGTVNRNGSHKFLVTVIDGNAAGGDGDDKFRIKIWADGSSSNVIYDNEFNAPENADSNTIIGGGSIVIHKPKGKNNKIDNTLDNQEMVDGLELKSWPNPTDSYFNIKVKSNNNIDNVDIMVFDVTNKLVFKNKFNPNTEFKFGENLEGGMYVIKIIQADVQKTIRLVKY